MVRSIVCDDHFKDRVSVRWQNHSDQQGAVVLERSVAYSLEDTTVLDWIYQLPGIGVRRERIHIEP